MKLTRTHKIIAICALSSTVAVAQFIVHDPIGDISWTATTVNVIATVKQLQQTYAHAVQMAQAINNTAGRWPSSIKDWKSLASADTFGVNANWNASNNSGSGILASFNKITTALDTSMAAIPPNFQSAAKLGIAAIERHDGLIQGNAAVIGAYMAAQPIYATSVANLAKSATTTDPAELTYAALQQKGLSATMLQVQAANVGNELAKQQLLNDNARLLLQRESATRDINATAYFYATAQSELDSSTAGNTTALHALKIP